MVSLNKIRIKGFGNIEEVNLNLQQITALLAPNNYGKSNVLEALLFGFSFIQQTAQLRQKMMGIEPYISINKHIAGNPFVFEIEGSIDGNMDFQYGYSFEWRRNRNIHTAPVSGVINGEFLRLKPKTGGKPKFSTVVNRTDSSVAKYTPSQTGRCDKELAIDGNDLVLNKLSNFDDLFYHQHIQSIRKICIIDADYLSDPRTFFAFRMVRDEKRKYLEGGPIATYLFTLKKEDPDTFALLISAVTLLIPTIESIDPVVVSANNLQVDDDAPFELSNQYDIVVKEKHNNQQTSFSYLSTGSMKLLYLLTTIVRASREGVQLLLVEELENSIHPSLLHSLLSVLKDFLGDTKLLFTSHSPNLVKYMSASQLYVGLPSDKGIADFRTIKPSKVKSVLQIAGAGDMALGEYLFKLMLEAESDADIIDHFFISKKEA